MDERSLKGFKIKLVSINNLIIGVATDIGPRILYLARKDRPQDNLFGVYPKMGMDTVEGFWSVYGGHRLWSSPEAKPRSYSMDDKPVEIKIEKDDVKIRGNPEKENSVRKEIEIKPLGKDGVQVVHRIHNIGRWPITLGCWALSLMDKEGFAVVPIKGSKVDVEGLLPDRHVSIWPYTSLEDERLKLTAKYLYVIKNPKMKKPFKIGTMANPNWAAYVVDGMAFVKEFSKMEGDYPDFGCSVEIYSNADMLEFETLSPMKELDPSNSFEHTEVWRILNTGKLEPKTEDIENKLEVLMKK